MNRVDLLNGASVLLVVLVAAAATLRAPTSRGLGEAAQSLSPPAITDLPEIRADEAGARYIEDSDGNRVRLGGYERIVAGSTVAADAVHLVMGNGSLVAVPELSTTSPDSERFTGIPTVTSTADVEAVLELRPDLLLYNQVGESDVDARLREQGITVLDLGGMTGAESWAHALRLVSLVLTGSTDAGDVEARRWQRRLERVDASLSGDDRETALVVSTYGEQLFGGCEGTSYHDVIEAAGLLDVSVGRFSGWPQYDPEAVLELNPRWIVTTEGMGDSVCQAVGVRTLDACASSPRRVVEIPQKLFGDPGRLMLDAAEHVFDEVYGTR